MVEEVALKSKRLKGTLIKILKEAAGSMRSFAHDLGKLKSAENSKALERGNARFKKSLASLQAEMEEMRGKIRAPWRRRLSPPSSLHPHLPRLSLLQPQPPQKGRKGSKALRLQPFSWRHRIPNWKRC